MGVLNPFADLAEQLDPLQVGQSVAVAVEGDGLPLDVFHGEIGEAPRRLAGVEDLGDGRVVHQGERLTLRPEAGHDLFGVKPRLDELERDLAADRLGLLGEPDLPHPSLAYLLEEAISVD